MRGRAVPQIFHRSFNTLSRLSIFGAVFLLAGTGWAWARFIRSDYLTGVGVFRDQPVQFSHQHHVAGLGIDCRYCHTSVETSSFAGRVFARGEANWPLPADARILPPS